MADYRLSSVQQKTKLSTGTGVEQPLHTYKGSTLLKHGVSAVRKNESSLPSVQEWGGPGDFNSTLQNFTVDTEVVDPDDETTGCFFLPGLSVDGSVGSVKQQHLIPLRNVSW